jgi:putative inorganic carbon (HCO3(-)) transporter
VTAELARAGGPVAAAGLALVLAGPRREFRLGGLAAWALGCAALALYLAPSAHRPLLAAGAVAGAVAACVGAWLLSRWPWLLALGALVCVPARFTVKVGGTQANLLVPLYGVVAAAGLALAWELWRGRDERARELGPLALPLAAFVLWSGLSLAWSQDLREGAIELLAFYLPFGLLAACLARLPWRREWLGALWVLLTGMAAVFAVVGIYQYETRDIFWNPKVQISNAYAPFYRVNSVFWDPSIYGRFLVLAILACLVLVVHGAARRVVLAATAAIVVIFAGLVLSFSQSSFVALAVGVAIVAWYAWGRWTLALASVVALIVVAAALVMPSVRHHSLNRASGGRSKLVTNGAAIAAHHPIQGVGIGGFKKAYAKRTRLKGKEPKAAASHDTPITVGAETGFVGEALYLWLLVSAFLLLLRAAGRADAGRVALILAASLAAMVVHSLFYNAFFEDPMAWGALGLAPLAAAALARERVSEPRRRAAAPPPPAVAAPPGDRTRAEAG